MEPRIQYAKTSEGVNIAYCVAGEGRNLLWVWPPPFSHVQLDWETVSSHIFQPLAKNQRLVWFLTGRVPWGMVRFLTECLRTLRTGLPLCSRSPSMLCCIG